MVTLPATCGEPCDMQQYQQHQSMDQAEDLKMNMIPRLAVPALYKGSFMYAPCMLHDITFC